jgi:hypothetical protein
VLVNGACPSWRLMVSLTDVSWEELVIWVYFSWTLSWELVNEIYLF